MNKKIELKPIYNNQVSFYKKTYFTIEEYQKSNVHNEKINVTAYRLYSYNTLVCEIFKSENTHVNLIEFAYVLNHYSFYSVTTLRHLKEFIKQIIPWNNQLTYKLKKEGYTKSNIEKYQDISFYNVIKSKEDFTD